MFSEAKMTKLFKDFLKEVVKDPEKRPELVETPRRMFGFWKEILEGENYTNKEIAKMFDKEFKIGSQDLVIMNDITSFSVCSHHTAPMLLNVTIAYLPNNGKVLGLSKFPRIVDMICRRLQVQENICMDISEVLTLLGIKDHMVVIDGIHCCVVMRGIKSVNSSTRTNLVHGKFKTDSSLRAEVMGSVHSWGIKSF